MDIVRNKKALTEAIRGLRAQGKTIGLVPTMGALHAGHISLVNIALAHADAAIASIFVNPTQFGPNEDFAAYPRMEAEDIKMLAGAGVAIAYIPDVKEMYAPGALTRVRVAGISDELEGAVRPGHFEGVATIVTKLFMQAAPDLAVFGEKDYQQLHLIRQFTRDLDLPVKVIGAPIVREEDGLAMSSRNRYLNPSQRVIAASLYRVLSESVKKISGGISPQAVLLEAQDALIASGFDKVDYVALRDTETLAPLPMQKSAARLLAAVHLGTTRLIDNMQII